MEIATSVQIWSDRSQRHRAGCLYQIDRDRSNCFYGSPQPNNLARIGEALSMDDGEWGMGNGEWEEFYSNCARRLESLVPAPDMATAITINS